MDSTAVPAAAAGVPSIDEITARLREQDYIAGRDLATVIHIALRIERPLFLEGETGVGKTEAARATAAALGARLIRLQCYEGIDLAHAAYEWNYARQLLHIRLAGDGADRARLERDVFGDDFLLRRPLLDAIDNDDAVAPLLLIDEIDRSDEEFEAYLLELLADFSITIPEIGTVRARRRPLVVVTSNRTREVHDALKRRCLYHWIDHPDLDTEVAIVRLRAPEASETVARRVAQLVRGLRGLELYKAPGVAESVDWARALAALGSDALDPEAVNVTLGAAVKHEEDLVRARDALPRLLEAARHGS